MDKLGTEHVVGYFISEDGDLSDPSIMKEFCEWYDIGNKNTLETCRNGVNYVKQIRAESNKPQTPSSIYELVLRKIEHG